MHGPRYTRTDLGSSPERVRTAVSTDDGMPAAVPRQPECAAAMGSTGDEGVGLGVKPGCAGLGHVGAVDLAGGGDASGRNPKRRQDASTVLLDVFGAIRGRAAEVQGRVGRFTDAADAGRRRDDDARRGVERPPHRDGVGGFE